MTAQPCPVWCDQGHPVFRDHCSSGWMCYIDLSVEDIPSTLEIYVEQRAREVGPRVVIGQLPAGRTFLGFLPAEAVHLATALIRLATMTADDNTPVDCESCATRL